MSPKEKIRDAVLTEREHIADMLEYHHFSLEMRMASPDKFAEHLAKMVRARTCIETGHLRGIRRNQLTGREKCRRCGDEILLPDMRTDEQQEARN